MPSGCPCTRSPTGARPPDPSPPRALGAQRLSEDTCGHKVTHKGQAGGRGKDTEHLTPKPEGTEVCGDDGSAAARDTCRQVPKGHCTRLSPAPGHYGGRPGFSNHLTWTAPPFCVPLEFCPHLAPGLQCHLSETQSLGTALISEEENATTRLLGARAISKTGLKNVH